MKQMNTPRLIQKYTIFLVLIALLVFFSVFTRNFFSFSNFMTIMRQVSMLGISATGMTMIVLMGEMDLSVGSVSALVGAGLGLVYQLLRPMIKILSFPFALVTLGLLYVLIDAGLLWAVAELIGGYTFDQFGWVFVTAITVNLLRRIFKTMAK